MCSAKVFQLSADCKCPHVFSWYLSCFCAPFFRIMSAITSSSIPQFKTFQNYACSEPWFFQLLDRFPSSYDVFQLYIANCGNHVCYCYDLKYVISVLIVSYCSKPQLVFTLVQITVRIYFGYGLKLSTLVINVDSLF